MGESFDHRPPGWIRQSRKRCTQFIHNRMVVEYRAMSSVDFGRGPRLWWVIQFEDWATGPEGPLGCCGFFSWKATPSVDLLRMRGT